MGMNNFAYQKSEDYPDCEPGTWEVGITDIRRGATKSGIPTIDFYIAIKTKESGWNGVPFKKPVMDGEYFDRSWSQMCDCFGIPPEKAGEAIHNFPLFANRTGKMKFAFEKNERKTTGYNPDGTPITGWVKVQTEYMQLTPLKQTSKFAVGAAAKTFVNTPEQARKAVAEASAQFQNTAQEGGFPEDIPF